MTPLSRHGNPSRDGDEVVSVCLGFLSINANLDTLLPKVYLRRRLNYSATAWDKDGRC